MTNTTKILVSGATGLQGGNVARALLKSGAAVRAFTRNPDSEKALELRAAGAEVVQGDFDDAVSLKAATAGMDVVYVMGTPFGTDPETETRQGVALIEAARGAGAGHIVYSSVASALDDTGVPHFESKAAVEHHLETVDVPHTVIAPAAFLNDLASPDMVAALRAGRYPSFLPDDVSLQQVSTADVGAFAALVLTQPERFAGQRIEIASIESTSAQVVAALSARTGREIAIQEIPIEAVREMGGDDLALMVQFFLAGGYTIDVDALHAAYPEVGWQTLDDWIATIDNVDLSPESGSEG